MSKRARLIVGLSTLGLLAYFAAGAGDYAQALTNVSWWALAAAYTVCAVDRVVMAGKWNQLLAVAARPLPLLRATQIYCASQIWGLFLPSTVGADAVRIGCTVAEGRSGAETTASVIVERAIGTLVTLSGCAVAMLWAGFLSRPEPAFAAAFVVVAAGAVAALGAVLSSMSHRVFRAIHDQLLARLPAWRPLEALRRLHGAYLSFAAAPRVLLVFVLWTVVEVLLGGLFVALLLRALGVQLGFAYVLAAFQGSALLGRIPVSISGLGVFEAGFVYLLALEGVPAEVSLVTSLLSRIVQIAVWLPWWGTYLLVRPAPAAAELTPSS